ncbi:MAG: hypothetical protein H0T15_04505 [Thermoleophilaceae bacterium]|nr:hypothetical protein [Thermoleophilaceae bacterium]
MRIALALICLTVAGAPLAEAATDLAPTTQDAAKKKRRGPNCLNRGRSIDQQNRRVVLASYQGSIGGELVVACLRSSRDRGVVVSDSRLEDEFEKGSLQIVVKLAGTYVGVARDPIDPFGTRVSCSIAVYDVRTRKERQNTSRSDPGTGDGCGSNEFALAETGQVAWLSGAQPFMSAPSGLRVHARGIRGGPPVILDPGPADGGSLRLSGTTASWTKDGVPQSADLASL